MYLIYIGRYTWYIHRSIYLIYINSTFVLYYYINILIWIYIYIYQYIYIYIYIYEPSISCMEIPAAIDMKAVFLIFVDGAWAISFNTSTIILGFVPTYINYVQK